MDKFYRVGFYFLVVVLLSFYYINGKLLPFRNDGQQIWTDIYTEDLEKTSAFFINTLEIATQPADDNKVFLKSKNGIMNFASVISLDSSLKENGLTASSIIYLNVSDFDKYHEKFIENGAEEITVNLDEERRIGIYNIPGGVTIGIIQFNQ
ncbi:MAG: hypothetical protein LBH46_02880 [Rickettsiales bacterium]|jgi:predicted enzyme related to lactoylglutathione lyase|nr:hypothetical protein [Rickettsiales bacterium]